MKKSFLLSGLVFFLIVVTLIAYNTSSVYGADKEYVLEINKILQFGFDEVAKGNFDAAIKYFNKAISLNEKNSYAYVGLGDAYTQKGHADKAIGYFNKAISLNEKNSYAYLGLGKAYTLKGDTDKAIGYFNKAISLDEKNSYAYYYLGLLYLSLNKEESALEKHKILENLNKDLADQLSTQIQLPFPFYINKLIFRIWLMRGTYNLHLHRKNKKNIKLYLHKDLSKYDGAHPHL